MDCGCSNPSIYYSEDFEARMCQNCGTIFMKDDAPQCQTGPFVHLRVHTHMSFLKATSKIEDLIEKAKLYKMTALAKTEFGNMCGAPAFVKECINNNIKPILGTEFDIKLQNGFYPIILIALNREGYKSLVQLNTTAWCERKNNKESQHILLDDIKKHNSGLIALLPCNGDYEFIKSLANVIREHIELYIEISDPQFVDVTQRIGEDTGLMIVATNNVLYTNMEDGAAYETALKIGKYQVLQHDEERYFKSSEEMYRSGLHLEWIENSVKIAERVEDYNLINKEFIVPTFKDEHGEWSIEQAHAKLTISAWQGLESKGHINDERYINRLQYELNVLKEKKFSSYFLIIKNIIDYVRSKGWLTGFGRGSAGGSIICYCLNITAIDPIKWDISFERFINPGRKDLPDIDTDITQAGRSDVLKYISNIHGYDRVAQIATFQTMGLRAAIDNVGRALGVPFVINKEIRNKISEELTDIDALPADVKSSLSEIDGWIDNAKALTGISRHFGSHAAGVVIANRPLGDLVPLLPESDGILGIQYDMKDLDILGLLKLDILGLKTLDIIQNTLDKVKRNHNVNIDIHNISLNDKQIYNLISTGDYVSLFQLDSPGYRKLCRQLIPEKFEHLMALNALFRPGPLEGGITDEYIERRHGRKESISWHPWLDEALSSTYQLPIYQEAIMAISKIIAGFDDKEADNYRSAVGKKNLELFNKEQSKFKEGALKRKDLYPPSGYEGTLEQWIDELLNKLAGYARYGWNCGHASSYGLITYATAFLETYYAAEYYASLLDSTSNSDKISVLMRGIINKFMIVTPDVNYSDINYTVKYNDNKPVIYMGLASIKNVGSAAEKIIEERNKNGKFNSFIEFCQRLPSVNKISKVNLVKAGAFKWDKSICDRDKIDNIDVIQNIARKRTKKIDGSKIPAVQIALECYIKGYDFTDLERQQNEKDVLSSFITGHPASIYQRLAANLEQKDTIIICPSMLNECEPDIAVIIVGMVDSIRRRIIENGKNKGRPYLSVTISDNNGVVFTNIWYPLCDELGKILVPGQIGMFECVTKPDRFKQGTMSVYIKNAVMLSYGIPIQGVFSNNGSIESVVNKIGGITQNVYSIGNRKYASIRGRITVLPNVLEEAIKEFGEDTKFLISMDASNE